MEPFIDRLHVVHRAVYHPVRHGRPVQDDAFLPPVHFLAVERSEHDVFHVHDIRYRGSRRIAVRHERRWCEGSLQERFVFPARGAFNDFLHDQDPFDLRRYDLDFLPDLFPSGMDHLMAAPVTDTIFFGDVASEVFIVKLKYRKVQNKNVGNCTYKM